MRTGTIAAAVVLTMCLGGCSYSDRDRNAAEHARQAEIERDGAARKAGHAAYDIAQEAKKAAAKAGTELKHATHDMHEGWKDAKRDAKESGKQ